MLKKLLFLMLALFTSLAMAVEVNSADATQLDSVKGVGPAIAAKIVEARKAGPFRDWTDFVNRVSGVGEASAARLSAGGLTVNGAPFKGIVATAPAPKAEKPATKPPVAPSTQAKLPTPPAAPPVKPAKATVPPATPPAADKASAAAAAKAEKKAEKEAAKAASKADAAKK